MIITKMNHKQFQNQFDELISKSEAVLVTSHIGPDHDAIGSVLSIESYISNSFQGKKVDIVFSGNPSTWNDFPGHEKIKFVDDLAHVLNKYDTVIFLDGSNYHRFSKLKLDLSSKNTICIDHHKSEPDEFNLKYIDYSRVSNCEIIYDIFFQEQCSKDEAFILLGGIMGDSGSLRFINYNNASVLSKVQKLVEIAQADLEVINTLFEAIPEDEFGNFKTLINNTHNITLDNAPNVTYTFLSKDDPKAGRKGMTGKYHMTVMRKIEDHPWGFIVTYDHDEDYFHLSFRSQSGAPNVRLLCEQYFSGGGHDKAAGGKMITEDKTLDSADIAEKIISIIKNAALEINP